MRRHLITVCVLSCAIHCAGARQEPGGARFDRALWEALVLGLESRHKEAFKLLDTALEDEAPTDNAHYFMWLYRTEFNTIMGRPYLLEDHSEEAKKHIAALRAKARKRVPDYVRLAILTPVGREPESIRPYVKAAKHLDPESPWNEWLRARLIEEECVRFQREVTRNDTVGGNCFNELLSWSYYRLLDDNPHTVMRKMIRQKLRMVALGKMSEALLYLKECSLSDDRDAIAKMEAAHNALNPRGESGTRNEHVEMVLRRVLATRVPVDRGPYMKPLVLRYFKHLVQEGVEMTPLIYDFMRDQAALSVPGKVVTGNGHRPDQ